MDLSQYSYYLIIDLEATCCDQNSMPRQEMEIIEIGAVMVESTQLIQVSEYQTFIQPVRHPILTPFCTKLTSITQEQVNQAPGFIEAIAAFKKWLDAYPNFLFGSWGDYDRKQIIQDCKYHNIPDPINSPHFNVKHQFTTVQRLSQRYGMAQALNLAQIPLVGTHHRGIDDARNIAKLLPYSLGREFLQPTKSVKS